MKDKKQSNVQYTVVTNGAPDYSKIPKAALEPIVMKFLENILKQVKEKKES